MNQRQFRAISPPKSRNKKGGTNLRFRQDYERENRKKKKIAITITHMQIIVAKGLKKHEGVE